MLAFVSPFDPVTESGMVVGFEPSAPHALPAPEELIRALANRGSGQAGCQAEAGHHGQTCRAGEPTGLCASWPGGAGLYRSGRQLRRPRPRSSLSRLISRTRRCSLVPCHLRGLAASLPAPARLGAQPKEAAAPPAVPPPAVPKSSASPSSSCQLATAIAQALSLLVSHLASQGEALDLTTAAAGLSSKGSAKRERLQQELMQRTGTFYLQVCQDAFRRLYPASAVPATLAELKADGRLSFVTYLERFGGYSQSRDLALVMHQLAFVADCLGQDDVHGAREHLGLLLASTEQAAQDRNWRWPVS